MFTGLLVLAVIVATVILMLMENSRYVISEALKLKPTDQIPLPFGNCKKFKQQYEEQLIRIAAISAHQVRLCVEDANFIAGASSPSMDYSLWKKVREAEKYYNRLARALVNYDICVKESQLQYYSPFEPIE